MTLPTHAFIPIYHQATPAARNGEHQGIVPHEHPLIKRRGTSRSALLPLSMCPLYCSMVYGLVPRDEHCRAFEDSSYPQEPHEDSHEQQSNTNTHGKNAALGDRSDHERKFAIKLPSCQIQSQDRASPASNSIRPHRIGCRPTVSRPSTVPSQKRSNRRLCQNDQYVGPSCFQVRRRNDHCVTILPPE